MKLKQQKVGGKHKGKMPGIERTKDMENTKVVFVGGDRFRVY
jgi:hypothetical protein